MLLPHLILTEAQVVHQISPLSSFSLMPSSQEPANQSPLEEMENPSSQAALQGQQKALLVSQVLLTGGIGKIRHLFYTLLKLFLSPSLSRNSKSCWDNKMVDILDWNDISTP